MCSNVLIYILKNTWANKNLYSLRSLNMQILNRDKSSILKNCREPCVE